MSKGLIPSYSGNGRQPAHRGSSIRVLYVQRDVVASCACLQASKYMPLHYELHCNPHFDAGRFLLFLIPLCTLQLMTI